MASAAMTIDGYPVVWKDRLGTMHYCDSTMMHPGVRLIWTTCGKHDVPANTARRQGEMDRVTCPACLASVA